ncbi:MAG: aminotransferase class V-fold PLP-dependent enzyme [Elusimicrobia bacterium]|nr:aminotransferase class V-fold PLP-dependent enzyme [Elusimicrobiota bacterium]
MNALSRRLWTLAPSWRYLNNGSFGACPRAVLKEQDRWRARLERQAVVFMDDELPGGLRRAAADIGGFVGARGEDVVFVDNATTGANAVLRSLPWRRGERCLLADTAYPAVRFAAERLAAERGFGVDYARVPARLGGPEEVVQAFERALRPRTRLVVVDHIAAPTALVFPVRQVARLAKAAGARLLVDGAHAPGQIPLDIPAVGADYYTGNLHKWLFAPKGSAILWARRSVQDGLVPVVTSNNAGQGFLEEFAWTGTRDPSPWLSAPAGLAFHRRLGAGRLMARNRALAWQGASLVAEKTGFSIPGPRSMYAAMVPVVLPRRWGSGRPGAERVHAALQKRKVEVPVFPVGGELYLRMSAQAYNDLDDFKALARVLLSLL